MTTNNIVLNDFGFSDVPDNFTATETQPVTEADNTLNERMDTLIALVGELKDKHEVELEDDVQAELDRRLQEMAGHMLPFLQKLHDAESDTIYWPAATRKTIISAQMEKINSLLP